MTSEINNNKLEEIGIGRSFQDVLCSMLENSYLFKDLTRQEIEQIAKYMHGYKAPKGSTLLKEGERDSFLIIISSGKAKVIKDDGYGESKEVAVVRKGATLGEMSIIDGFPHSATAITTEDSEVAIITKANLQNITENYPSLGVKLLWQLSSQLSARVRQATGQLVEHV